MHLFEQLAGRLAKFANMSFIGHSLIWVGNFGKIDVAFVGVWVVNVVVLDRVLLASEDQINPQMQILRHVGTFQSLAVLA